MERQLTRAVPDGRRTVPTAPGASPRGDVGPGRHRVTAVDSAPGRRRVGRGGASDAVAAGVPVAVAGGASVTVAGGAGAPVAVTSPISSTRPQPSACAALNVSPDRARYAVRSRPIRTGRLAVPPAPGISPIPTSGNRITVSGAASTRPANAASSIPAPTQAPCRCAVTRGPHSWSSAAGLRRTRSRWAWAGSRDVPNSARSPPLQNAAPFPYRSTCAIDGSATATCSASHRASRVRASNALRTHGRSKVMASRSPSRHSRTGSAAGRGCAGAPRPARLGSLRRSAASSRRGLQHQPLGRSDSAAHAQHLRERDGGGRLRRDDRPEALGDGVRVRASHPRSRGRRHR